MITNVAFMMRLYFVAGSGGFSVVNSESYSAQVVNIGKLEFYEAYNALQFELKEYHPMLFFIYCGD